MGLKGCSFQVYYLSQNKFVAGIISFEIDKIICQLHGKRGIIKIDWATVYYDAKEQSIRAFNVFKHKVVIYRVKDSSGHKIDFIDCQNDFSDSLESIGKAIDNFKSAFQQIRVNISDNGLERNEILELKKKHVERSAIERERKRLDKESSSEFIEIENMLIKYKNNSLVQIFMEMSKLLLNSDSHVWMTEIRIMMDIISMELLYRNIPDAIVNKFLLFLEDVSITGQLNHHTLGTFFEYILNYRCNMQTNKYLFDVQVDFQRDGIKVLPEEDTLEMTYYIGV